MKNSSVFILVLGLVTALFAQKITVTPEGIRSVDDLTKSYVVINLEGKTAKQLYDNTIKYITQIYRNPDDVIKGKVDADYIKFQTFAPEFIIVNNSGAKIKIDAAYTTELSFKDNKVKYEIAGLNMSAQNGGMPVLFSGKFTFTTYPIYNAKNELKRPDVKTDIEYYFNAQINAIQQALNGSTEKDNW